MYEPVDVAKTHEILARFRPIAPKPQLPPTQLPSSLNPPALQLRSRRCRFRKRDRPPLPSSKRQKTTTLFPFLTSSPPGNNLLTLDLLQKLQQPKIIAPRPVRPVGSSISVGHINALAASSPQPTAPMSPKEVEDEVESETLPVVVSDYRNRVRLANSAYKELVGQPECMWLDSMVYGDCEGFGLRPLSRRINGEVMLEFAGDSTTRTPPSMNGFSCRVRIEWTCNGRKTFVDAPCDVIPVYCESKEYLFIWKFHIVEAYRTG